MTRNKPTGCYGLASKLLPTCPTRARDENTDEMPPCRPGWVLPWYLQPRTSRRWYVSGQVGKRGRSGASHLPCAQRSRGSSAVTGSRFGATGAAVPTPCASLFPREMDGWTRACPPWQLPWRSVTHCCPASATQVSRGSACYSRGRQGCQVQGGLFFSEWGGCW